MGAADYSAYSDSLAPVALANGSDTYIFRRGDGNDVILDLDPTLDVALNTDTLRLVNITHSVDSWTSRTRHKWQLIAMSMFACSIASSIALAENQQSKDVIAARQVYRYFSAVPEPNIPKDRTLLKTFISATPYPMEYVTSTMLKCRTARVEISTLCSDMTNRASGTRVPSCSYQAVRVRDAAGKLLRVHQLNYDYEQPEHARLVHLHCANHRNRELIYADGQTVPCSNGQDCPFSVSILLDDTGQILHSTYIGHKGHYRFTEFGAIQESLQSLTSSEHGREGKLVTYAHTIIDASPRQFVIKQEGER